jgi:ubiquinone/menaquinone biosynthesis C-methylase UbiE
MTNFIQTLKQLTSQGVEGYFAVKYADFAKSSEEMQKEYKRLAEDVALIIQEGKFLEIGPGPAYIAIEIAKRLPDVEIIGLEISDSMIEIAIKNTEEQRVSKNIFFKKGDASKMPFDDEEFDFVITSGSLHHWKKPVEVINEIHRILKPKCKALISDLRKDAPKESINDFASKIHSKLMRWGLMHSFREGYTTNQIENLIEATHFKKAQIRKEEISMQIILTKQVTEMV